MSSSVEQLSEADKARMKELQDKRKETGGHITDSERLELTGLMQKEAAGKEQAKAGKEEPGAAKSSQSSGKK